MNFAVWAVVYSNFDPQEVDTLWETEELAKRRVGMLSEGWKAVEWPVNDDTDEDLLAPKEGA
jgi:hypothetical protein